MNSTKIFLMAGIFILFAHQAMAQVKQPGPAEVNQLTQTIISNNPQISNPDLIYPGDTVRVVEDGKVTVYTVGRWTRQSKNGCLWQIANAHLLKKHLQVVKLRPEENSTTKTVVAQNPVPKPQIIPEVKNVHKAGNQLTTSVQTKQPKSDHFFVTGYFFGIITFLFFASVICVLRKYLNLLAKNPNKYAPVISGGLPKDAVKAFQLLAKAYPRLIDTENLDLDAKQLTELSRGNLFRHFGPNILEVQMAFEDGIHKVRITSGDPIHRLTFNDGSVYFFRSTCGNLYVSNNNDPFLFPEGWGFVSEVSTDRLALKCISLLAKNVS